MPELLAFLRSLKTILTISVLRVYNLERETMGWEFHNVLMFPNCHVCKFSFLGLHSARKYSIETHPPKEQHPKMRHTNIIMSLVCLAAFATCSLAQSNTTLTQTVKETVTATVTAAPTTMTTKRSTNPSVTSAEPTYPSATSIPYGRGVVYHPENCTYSDALIPDDITPPVLEPPEAQCKISWGAVVDVIDISWSGNVGVKPETLEGKLVECGGITDFILWDKMDSNDDIEWSEAAPNARYWMQASALLGKHYCIQDSIKKAGYQGPPVKGYVDQDLRK
ncbi:uncharacterized protein MYCFIDRAFT_178194 [Pseudocercospora fijiensis CIRAD86]|uniref:Uncharacterized protein n=1 Tax=Pseudocercospora fijiensis (strain CIRAD86) TaxID=383855 RepID=M2YPD3_PSEFD|nr:uncharacterized protein MYCFIDRAFT_178194 [Pseudocercospora fijiensis CIRAD86]EME79615.1 hypothetical protein MYCFIDRAFT_178194 [Pseudocercospora fijiensis CIRAD86]